MHIVHVTPSFFDERSLIGGGERYVDELAKAQAKMAGCTVIILSFAEKRMRFVRHDVRYEILPSSHFGQFSIHNPFSLRHFFFLRRADVIHVHQLCTFVSDVAALAAKVFRVPLVGIDHGGGGAWVLNTRLPVFRWYDRIFAQSRQAVDPLKNHFDGSIELIPGGVDLERFCPSEDGSVGQTEILFVGRLMPHKGVDLLIQSFKKLEQRDWKLRIVGRPADASYFEKLKALASGHPIYFETDLADDDVVRAYQGAGVTVLPSVRHAADAPAPELMGFTVLESQACGTPVVCSDSGPMREFVSEGKTGWVFKSGDESSLTAALNMAVQASQSDRHALSERCCKHVRQFSWGTVSEKYLCAYRDVLRVKVKEK